MQANGLTTNNNKIKFTIAYFLIALIAFILAGCSGTEENTDLGSKAVGSDGTELYLKLADSNNSPIRTLSRNASAPLIATLRDSNGNPLVGEIVTFSTDLGSIEPEKGTGLTDSSGQATVHLTTSDEIGAGLISAIVERDLASVTVTYGFSVSGGSVSTTTDNTTDTTGDTNTDQVSSSVSGSIEFVSASPSTIALRGTGGAGLSEFSTVKFKIIGTDGLPMSDKQVSFSLNTTIGGLDIDPVTATSNREGIVTTTVQSGTVPTSVRITAVTTITDIDGNSQTVETQSDQLAVSTGIPDQNSMTIALSKLNPEAWGYNGETVDVTVQLADHFNNFVPDGTTVYFTTEGGSIEPSCQTVKSGCTVKWVSQNPRPADHRVTILATVLGNESFQDTDSDGVYTLVDGEAFIDANSNNVFDEPFTDTNDNKIFDEPFFDSTNGIYDGPEYYYDLNGNGQYDTDAAEIYVDDNPANGQYDVGESYEDFNGNGQYDAVIAETFIDRNGNGTWDSGEKFTDALNGRYDYGESFTDLGDGKYNEGEPYVDANGNNKYDAAETYTDANDNGVFDAGVDTMLVDINGNNSYDEGLSETFTDKGDGFWDENEDFVDAKNGVYDVGEYFIDAGNGIYDDGEYFIDYNGNGLYDGAGNNAAGETAFTDSNNGNGVYDGSGYVRDGETYTDINANTLFDGPGYPDLGEPFLDANENGIRDVDEVYVDTDNDGEFDNLGDGKLNSILCQVDNNCSADATIHVRATATLIMAGSFAKIEVYDAQQNVMYYGSNPNVERKSLDVSHGRSRTLVARITDSAGQVMPVGTTISVSSTGPTLSGTTSFKIGDTTGASYTQRRLLANDSEIDLVGGHSIYFSISDPDRKVNDFGNIVISVKTEKGNETVATVGVSH